MNFIYLTTNLISGKQYVGSHNGDINDSYLGSGKLMLKTIKKHGKENFKREILEECDPSLNLILETKYIKEYDTIIPNGYNISPTGGHGLKGKVSIETREKIKLSQLGKKKIDYFIEKYGDFDGLERYNDWLDKVKFPKGNIPWMKDKTHTKESNDKNRLAHLGIPNLKLKGFKHTKESREKMSKSAKGKKQSNYTIEKRREKLLGITRSDETKRKISNAHKGKNKKYDVWNKNKTSLDINIETISNVKDLKKSGLTQKKIAEELGFSVSAIARMLNGFYDNKLEQISRGK